MSYPSIYHFVSSKYFHLLKIPALCKISEQPLKLHYFVSKMVRILFTIFTKQCWIDSPFSLPNWDGSVFGLISLIIQSAKRASYNLERFFVPEIFLRSSVLLGGQTFGTGVMNSCFHRVGQTPPKVAGLQILARGLESSTAYSKIILHGMSPFTVYAF